MYLLKLECIGDDTDQQLKLGKYIGNEILRGLGDSIFGGFPKRYWVAEITGKDLRYKFKREFLKCKKDYTDANNTGSRGIFAYYNLAEDKVYQVSSPESWKRVDKYYCTVKGGELVKMSQEDVEQWLNERPALDIAEETKKTDKLTVQTAKKVPAKHYLDVNVYDAAVERIKWTFDTFNKIYISFSGGKDSSVMLHLVMDEAIKRGRKIGVLFMDLEGQYKITIAHIQQMYDLYAEHIDPYWICLPIALRNAVSQYEPKWTAWGDGVDWVRQPPNMAITDRTYFPFYHYDMEFEEFVPAFGKWYGDGELTACFVGIRADESLNRYRTIVRSKSKFGNKGFTTWCGEGLYNVYPIYDWRTQDIWTYNAKFNKSYNRLYDLMHQAGLSIHQMRICQPYGDDQRKGLWLFQIIEPETWGKIVARVNGANQGALYAQNSGNILGRIKITKPEGHTWESFAKLLLASMPDKSRVHFENKIAVFLKWYQDRGYPNGIPDFADAQTEAKKEVPSWRRICKALLRNDYWCKGLSFTQTKSEAYAKYLKVMKRRRQKWGL